MLRDYQQDLYVKTVEAMRRGYRRPLVVAPCGAGKSFLFAEMIRKTRGEALVLTHRQELLRQHEELLEEQHITNARVAMILTEANHLGEHPTPAVIIADEAHLSRSNSWMRVIDYYDTYTIGFTATPCRLDGKPLGDVYNTLIEGVDARWLIDHKHLAPYEYYAPSTVDTEKLKVVRGDYVTAELEKLMMERAIYGNVIDSYCRLASGERTIAYCVSVNHARETAEAFRLHGIRSEVLSADTPPVKRKQILGDFRNGKITVLCNVGIISEGVSINEVSCCILLRPTESVALGIQQMMRCMRYLPGKTARIVDMVGNYTRIGLPDEPRSWSLTESVKKRRIINDNGDFYIRTCPECFMVFPTAPVCPFCGAEYPLKPRELQARADIELARISAEEAARVAEIKKKSRQEQGRATTFEELVKLGKQRGYKNPAFWASQVMRGRKR